jgi:hypothetical protein
MQIEKNLPTRDIYDHYITSESVVIPFDNNFSYHLPTGSRDDMVYFQHEDLKGLIKYNMVNNNLFITIAGHVDLKGNDKKSIDYIAASPISRGYSYSGSGLPYPNPEMAYEGTPNIGTIHLDSEGDFKVELEYPNAYYVKQGTILLNPHVHFYLKSEGKLYTLDVGRPVQNRSLTGLPDRFNRTTGR